MLRRYLDYCCLDLGRNPVVEVRPAPQHLGQRRLTDLLGWRLETLTAVLEQPTIPPTRRASQSRWTDLSSPTLVPVIF